MRMRQKKATFYIRPVITFTALVLLTIVLTILAPPLPIYAEEEVSGSVDDVFRNNCSKLLGEGHSLCREGAKLESEILDHNSGHYSEGNPMPLFIISHDASKLYPQLNKIACSAVQISAEPVRILWNNNSNTCSFSPREYHIYKFKAGDDGEEVCSHIAYGIGGNTFRGVNKTYMILSIAAHNKCSLINNNSDQKECEKMSWRYKSCLALIDELSEQVFPADQHEVIPDIPPTDGKLEIQDFEEISLYAKYARTVLDSCIRTGKRHCSLISVDDNLVPINTNDTEATINLKNRSRIGTIIALTAYGSAGKPIIDGRFFATIGECEDSNRRMSNLPNLMTNTREDLIPKCPTEPNPDINRYDLNQYDTVYKIDRSTNTCLKLTGAACPIFSSLDFVMNLNAKQSDVYCNVRCTYYGTPYGGAKKLINFCKNNDEKCRPFLAYDGLLSDYKSQPMFLQTMYWNSIDLNSPDPNSGITWNRLKPEEKQHITWVINNPDTSPLIALPAPDEEEESIGDSPIPCDFEGGLGWLLCGGSDFLMRSYDGAYGELENWMTIKPTILDPSKALNDDGEPVMQKNPVKEIWQTMMGIANVLVIFAILVVIISHVTGYGLSNYNIKTMLPKVVIAVILINLSYFIIQLLVEVSNLVGHGIYAIIVNASKVDQINPASIVNLYRLTTDSTNLLTIITFIIGVLLWLITMLLQLLILSGRDAILIITTVTAPIIAILYFLPGSKKITSLWSKGLMFSLALFPMTALVYAMGRLGYQLSITSSTDFVSGLVSHTILVLPMIFTPYLTFKLGKGIPIISAGLSKLSTYAMQRASGTYKPKEGSRLWYKQKRLEDIDKQVRAGQYAGLRPIRALKSAIYRRIGDSRILAGSTAQLQTQLAQRHSERAELLTTNDANNIISHYQAIENAMVTRQPAAVPRLQASSAGMAKLMASGGNDKDLIIEAGLAQIKNAITTDDTINIETFAQSLHLARMNGASQDELQAAHREALSYFKGSNNFAATGELKALESYYTDHPNSEGETWGNYDPAMYANRTDSSGNDTEFTTYRKKAIRSDMIHQVLQQPLDEDGKQKSLDAEYMPDGSVAREVFVDEYHNNAEFEAQIRKQANSFSSETYQSLDNSLNLGLSYDAFSANLTQELVDNINKSKYKLNQTDQINLSRLLRQAGYRNYDAESIRLSNNLHELRAIVNNIRVLTVDERDNIIGHSLKARVPKYDDPAPHLQQRIDISQRGRGKRRGSKKTKRRRS